MVLRGLKGRGSIKKPGAKDYRAQGGNAWGKAVAYGAFICGALVRWVRFPLVSALLLLAGAAALGETAPQMVTLPDGRKIHFECQGQGTPAVILTAGNTNWSGSWSKVEGAIAAQTRVCVWDRAGFGYSGPSPEPQDVLHTLADLENSLAAAKLAAPYILVSQSAGSYESLLFADRHPRQVAGLVLVDPSIPDQPQRFAAAAPAYQAAVEQSSAHGLGQLKSCAQDLRALRQMSDSCFALSADLPDAAKAALNGDPDRLATEASRVEQFDASARQVINPARKYGALPLIVLTAESVAIPDGLPPQTGPALNAEWRRAHDELAALSTRGVDRIIAANHAIPVEKPEAVIAAITDIINQARKP